MADRNACIQVEVVFAEPGQVWSRRWRVPAGTCVGEALDASGLARDRPDVDLATQAWAVYGRRAAPEQVLHDGDRIEICRPLRLDPMEARRRRAR